MQSGQRDRLLYLSQWAVFSHPELYKDYQVPNYFSNWLEKLPRKIQQKYGITYSTLYIGPKGTGTSLHIDNRNTSAWLAVLSGRKRFIFFSPDQESFLYDGAVDALNPDLERFPLYAKAQPVEVILEAGDLVYFPSKWWHQVENLEDSIALSHNLVDEWNADVVLQSAFEESPVAAHIFQFICEFPWIGRLLALAN
jgi:Cupin-like domain